MLEDRSYMRGSSSHSQWSASIILVIVNTIVFVLQLATGLSGNLKIKSFMMSYLALSPDHLANGWVWELITYQFLHGGPLHLIINCAMLWMFGTAIESNLGKQTFLKLYFSSGVIGGLLQVACSWIFRQHFGMHPVVGASSGIFGLIAAYAALNWETPITTLLAFIIPVTMRAKYLILVLAIIACLGLLEPNSQIAHAAHLGGLLGGLGFVYFLVLGGNRLFPWRRLKPRVRPQELVRVRSPKHSFWQKQKNVVDEELPPAEFISKEVDPILDKISAHGIQSLTTRERQILEAARAKMGKR